MAPEQADPKAPVGPPADVWSLGLIAFTLFTGRIYWLAQGVEGDLTPAALGALANEPIVAASARAASFGGTGGLPPGFDGWFKKCVDRNPARRFKDATAASDAFLKMIDAPVKAPMGRRQAGIAAAVVVVGGLALWWTTRPPPPPVQVEAPPPPPPPPP